MNMRKRAWAGGCFLVAALLLSGCWSRHELNDLSIVVGLGIDKAGESYKVTIQVVNPSQVVIKKAGGGVSPVIAYSETGATLPEALSRMTIKAPRRLYFAHMRIMIIGEDVAKEGIGKPLDFIARNRDMRTDFYLIVAKHASAEKVLMMNSAIDPIPANNLYTKLENSDKMWAATGKITLDKLLEDLYRQGKSPSMTGIEVIGDVVQGRRLTNAQYVEPRVLLTYSGMAAFKRDRLVGWLDENDTKALNYVQNDVKETTGYIGCPQGRGQVTMQIIRSHAKMTVKLRNERPEFHVYIHTEQDISDNECDIDVLDPKFLEQVKQSADNRLAQLINKTVQKAQKQLGADIFGFGDAYHRAYPARWKQVEDWNKEFTQVSVYVHPNVVIRRIGTTLQSVNHETVR